MSKFYITGCAKTGTHLLRRLFYAFDDMEVIIGETPAPAFLRHPQRKKHLCGKRGHEDPLSGQCCDGTALTLLEELKASGAFVIHCKRTCSDVEQSGIAGARYQAADAQAEKFSGLVDACVWYEELCKDPNAVQWRLARRFGLTPVAKWSDYPAFVPGKDFETIRGQSYAPRPIDTSRINKAGAV